ncbi:MAG: glycine/sarcosine/betaine reductase complex component C subunit beta [Peptoniphilaceae bacterium]|uniref:glycine/sarcosine/betaine reductase complex component C subunit beta n=1 Tax=Parvimonas sp. TaxID=1944660 RepID=UPI0025D44D51|nr:glycine/sarcosine/betaine reductase complex component C subunit beta [Parvimonas sp.]MCI5996974.1 glycine/sarcosine/betaine reductase complex component C subunit beta [Parvimonas sp.]MDD7765060.1 glycine/sarcosine/betaine reductase complex component C subunit beta [Peptoniphilaceae bacterium]MDY3050256.1 glycine/sarcosine/betaine reductase complex component C subunit beta [Parvimonas sp.]
MNFPVLKGTSYVLVHAPDMIVQNGTTQTTEKALNPNSEYLKEIPNHIRKYDEVLKYLPNQVYIGNKRPEDLKAVPQPWSDSEKYLSEAPRFGKYGEIMPEHEFIGLMKICDAFDLVLLNKEFTELVKADLEKHPLVSDSLVARLKEGVEQSVLEGHMDNHAEGLFFEDKLVGVVTRAHDVDVNLSAHVMLENLVTKASGLLAALHLVEKNNINPADVEYVIECSEEACGDMNQRGGGNFAKSIAELAGFDNASGSDLRGFCAAPTHTLIAASSHVHAGTFKHVVIVAGGCTAKLGMNGKDHVKKGLPILEDVIGGFAALISENDGVNPILRTDIVGRHTVGTGSSPQAVMSALVTAPLEKANLTVKDVDKYSAEMQNPDITKPAGAGDVPNANFKMIGALGVMKKQLEKAEIPGFIENHGMEGWAPTQGHIPSGVPYLGFCREDLTEGELNRAMIIGKGSLFLGRMTNLFDGVSIVLERNSGKVEENSGVSKEEVKKLVAEAMRNFASSLIEE